MLEVFTKMYVLNFVLSILKEKEYNFQRTDLEKKIRSMRFFIPPI